MNTNSSVITGITTHDNRGQKGLFSNMMEYVSTAASNVVSGLTGVMSGATTEAKEIIHPSETTTYNTSVGGKKSKKMRKSNKSKKGKRVRKTRKTKGHSNKRSGKRHRRKMGSSRR